VAPPALIDPGTPGTPQPEAITAISCATSSFCVAADDQGNLFMYDGTSWTQSSEGTISGYPDIGPFDTVSCPTTSFCMAAGTVSVEQDDDAGTPNTTANPEVYAIWNGTAWAAVQNLPAIPDSTTADNIESLSCTSSSFCMAGFSNGDYATYNGSTWTLTTSNLPFLYSAWTGVVSGSGEVVTWVDGPVVSVSCTSASFCAATSSASGYLLTATWNGSAWATGYYGGQEAPGNPQVSCASASSCVVVQGTNGTSDQPAITYNGSTWAAQSSPDDTANVMDGVSCPTATTCIGVDSAGDAVAYDGTSWGTAVPVFSSTAATAISCPTATFCAAGAADGAVSVLTSTGWSTPTVIATVPQPGTPNSLSSVSCPTTIFCAAVDGEGNVVTMQGTSWSAPVLVASGESFTSVSCPTASFCVAVDLAGQAVTYDGTSWSSPVTVGASSDGFENPSLVSCPSTTVCTAIFDQTPYQWNGSTWTSESEAGQFESSSRANPTILQRPIIYAISCTSATFCFVGGSEGFLIWFDPTGTAGAALGSLDSNLDYSSVSCASSSMCVAVDYANGEAVTWNGTALSAPTIIDLAQPGVNGVSCPTTTMCEAIVGYLPAPVITLSGPKAPVKATPISSVGEGWAVYDNDGAWSEPVSIDTDGMPTSISCASPTMCVAVDNAGNQITGEAPATTCPPLTSVITISGGGGQSTQVNTAFAKPLTATVTCDGQPDTSPVTWSSPSSGASGAVTSTGSDTATATANGTAGSWQVAATIDGVSATATLTNTAAPVTPPVTTCPPLVPIITISGGSDQATQVNTAFAKPLTATVTCNGEPDTSPVTWSSPSSGASGVLTSTGADTATATANGVAGSWQATATIDGVSATATLTNLAAPPTTCPPLTPTITISGGNQSAQVNTAFAKPLVATVTCDGQPDTSPVTWSSPSSGASGVLTSTGADTATVKANGATGPWQATATIDGVSATATLTNTAPPCVTQLAIHNGGQVAKIGADFAAPLVVDATCAGTPVPNLTVTVSLPTTGGTFVTGSPTAITTTDQSGVATTPVVVASTNPVTWVATASAPSAAPVTTVLTNAPVPVAPPALVNSGHPGPPVRGDWVWILVGSTMLVFSFGAGLFVVADRKRGVR